MTPKRSRILRWLGGVLRRKGYMPGPGGIGFVAGAAETYPIYDYEALNNAYAVNPWVNACVKRIAETVASLPLKVYQEVGKGPDVEREEVYEHPLVDLLWKPGRFLSAYDLIYRTAGSLALTGESWWFIENGSAGKSLAGQPKEIRLFPSQFMGVKQDKLDLIAGYAYRKAGQEMTFDPEFIVQAKTFNPNSDFRGLPPMEVARAPVLMEYYLTRYNTTFFQNSARPDLMLTSDLPLGEDARKIAAESWKKAYGGVEKSHGVAVLEGLKPQLLGTTAKDGEFLGLDKLTREQVLAIFGMPPGIVGILEYANYANMREQIKQYYRYTIAPLCTLIEHAINTQLIPVWYRQDENLYVEFDLSQAATMPEDQKLEAETAAIWVRGGIKTVNEVRREMNMPDVDWGDEPPVAPANPFAGLGLGVEKTPSPDRFFRATLPATRDDQWKAMDRLALIGEARLEKALFGFFGEQCDRVVKAVGGKSIVRAPVDDFLLAFDDEFENAALGRMMQVHMERVVGDAGAAALHSVGSGVAFDFANPRVQSYLAKKVMRVVGINATTKEMIREVLVAAAMESLSVSEIATRIRSMFDDMRRWRAETIARTEIIGANNAGALEGYQQSGVVEKKEWLSVRDESVRDSHGPAPLGVDGEIVPLGSVFSNGLDAPGGDGPPEEVINCRCTILPVLGD